MRKLLALLLLSTPAAADPIQIDVRGDVDADAVTSAIGGELRQPVQRAEDSCEAPCLSVAIEDGQATVVFTTESGATRTRTVPLGDDRTQWPTLITLLAGNLVRDEAADVLPLIPEAAPPPAKVAASHRRSSIAVGFTPVLSSDLVDLDVDHDLSLFLIAGYAHDVDGIAVSGVADVARGKVDGIQLAGVATAADEVDGMQIAGVAAYANTSDGVQIGGTVAAALESGGVQIGGVVAASAGKADVQGGGVVAASLDDADLQIAGVVSATGGKAGAQFGGVVAASLDNADLQIGGVVAASGGKAGAQFGGVVAASLDDADLQIGGAVAASTGRADAQFGGAVAVAADRSNLQIAGAVAVSGDDADSQFAGAVAVAGGRTDLQIAGAVSVASDVDGVQVAGAVNVAGDVDGIQIAPINVAGHVDGVQVGIINIGGGPDDEAIGLINIVPGGRTDIEGTVDSTSIGAVMLRHGGRHFHNVYALAGQRSEDGQDAVWMYGLGLGPSFHIASVPVDLEAIAYEVNHGGHHEKHLSLLGQLRLTVEVPHTPVVVGAALNSYVSTDQTSPLLGVARTTMPTGPMTTDATWRVWPSVFVGARF